MFQSVITLVVICLIVYFVVKAIKKSSEKSRQRKEEEQERLINETQTFLAQAKENKTLPVISTSIMIEIGEYAHLQESVKLMEPKTIRRSTGGGGRVRIARGVSIGGWSGQFESQQVWRDLDVGALVLTNKRLFFKGQNENRVFLIKKIIEVGKFTDAVQISSESRTKSSVFTVRNPYLWASCIEFVKNN